MNKKLLLGIGLLLIGIGIFKPILEFPIKKPVDSIVIVTPPSDPDLKQKCQLVVDVLRNGGNERIRDGRRLSDLYLDLATLVELDGEDRVIKTTEDINQANSLTGVMLRMNLKGKYPGLSDGAQAILLSQIGDDNVPIDDETRKRAVDAFRALSWACNEGTK